MNEERKLNLGEKQNPYGADKKINFVESFISNGEKNRDVLKWVVISLAGLAVVFLIFGAGMSVGGMKVKFSYRWAESYHKNFAGPRGGFLGDWRRMPLLPGDFIEGHGAFGEIIELKDNGFVVKGRGDIEKIIIITEDTIIKEGMKTVKDNLKVGDRVVIIGSPNEEGQIEAELIRVFNEEETPRGPSIPYRAPRTPFL